MVGVGLEIWLGILVVVDVRVGGRVGLGVGWSRCMDRGKGMVSFRYRYRLGAIIVKW